MPAHLAGKRRPGLGHAALDEGVAGLPHLRPAARFGHGVEQRLARLHVRDDARARPLGKQVAREQDEQLVRPEHLALAVHRAQPVAVAVERDAEVQALAAHQFRQLGEVFRHGRIGMVGREGPVDGLVQQHVPARQPRREPRHDAPGRAVARVPADAESRSFAGLLGEARDIGILDSGLGDRAPALDKVTRSGERAERADALAEKGFARHHHLEAVIVRRVVRAGNHDARVEAQMVHGEIEHRRRPEADARHVDAGGGKPFHQRRLEAGRAQPAVTAHRRAPPAAPRQHGAEGAAEGGRIRLRQRLADDAARVVFPEEARVEVVPCHDARPLPTPR